MDTLHNQITSDYIWENQRHLTPPQQALSAADGAQEAFGRKKDGE